MSNNSSKTTAAATAAGIWSNPDGSCPSNSSIGISATVPVIFMTIGTLSNIMALIILIKAYEKFKQKSKASFLLFASGLVITDCLGHIINGAITVRIYALNRDWKSIDPSENLCRFLGTCMVFFGLSPLFLGSVMAIERCVGITQPLLHSAKMTSRHTKRILGFTWLFALSVALLPNMRFGEYKVQCSQTWCFIKTHNIQNGRDVGILLLFSSLGLTALGISLLCNSVTVVVLIRSGIKSRPHRQGRSHHVEMVVQLVTIVCVSCICWGPLLVMVAVIGSARYLDKNLNQPAINSLLFQAVRMAAWNQILDPWVYILLRKAILTQLYTISMRCLGRKNIDLQKWNCNSVHSSIKIATIEGTLASSKKHLKVTTTT
ncbi:prostaglandin F2-alpha receptor [Callorhinchus milii]|uniref:Prostaglandin F2-alpha receptor n=1 Tax=Callorhinchus milii TaxID=7868 RepID=A0A4W3HVN7_CALMI|nr:prostaglandin F2-alpha receptor [Callorhinchus milii]|eukprot:gi/632940654/ref/XP_007885434.1/ PREDICTED: prostaglandin F2-alpha receptor isoform X1 [Callorhinchus milii]